jgi:hypothetical protein
MNKASAERDVLIVRDPSGRWYLFPREEAERWRLSDEQEAEALAQMQEAEVVGFEAGGASPFVAFGIESLVSPRDAASGQATGKRSHRPFVITKTIDKASRTIY